MVEQYEEVLFIGFDGGDYMGMFMLRNVSEYIHLSTFI